jgi:hypothetical protein
MSTAGLAFAFAGLVCEAAGGGGMLEMRDAGGETMGGRLPRPGGGGGRREGDPG